jgi:hypothetical protein
MNKAKQETEAGGQDRHFLNLTALERKELKEEARARR